MFEIDGRPIGPSVPPFIIAEMSGNHNGSIDRALEIVEAAATAGADALKIQTYTADTMTLDTDADGFRIDDQESLWFGRRLYDLYKEAHTPWEWHEPIITRCRDLGLIPISTPFDETAVDFLKELNLPALKIASFENTDLPLIRRAAATGKPLIISTGMASLSELTETLETALDAGCSQLLLLKCTSTYPANPELTNLATLVDMQQRFGVNIGISDHTVGIGVAIAAIGLGAVAIEKHFTLNRTDGGVDSAFSLEPNELATLVTESERAWRSVGTVSYGPTAAEQASLVFRRSLYFVEDLRAGDLIQEGDIRRIRPGHGLAPRFESEIIGRKVRVDITRGTPVKWALLD